jgi:SAM-dependent methyltransferase
MDTGYSFGDSSRAGRRLALLARVFDAPSRAFPREAGLPGRELAVDLGCGPGFTTHLVSEVLASERTVGLDASEAFVAAARRSASRALDFAVHDVTRPLPTAPADLIYARLLVSHLPDPAGAIDVWARALRPGGRLLLDEVEWIRSEGEIFRRSLALVEALLSDRGQCLYVGPRLDPAVEATGRRRVTSRVRIHPVDARDAATLFSLNLAELRQNDAMRDHIAAADLADLEAGLAALCGAHGPEIRWGLRQVALEE